MLTGVIGFSFATGILTSIIQNYDDHDSKYQEQLDLLNAIQEKYNFPMEIYGRMKKSLDRVQSSESEEIHLFLN